MLTPKELAAELGLSVSTIRSYASEGLIPSVKTPRGHRRYDLDEVRAALRAHAASSGEKLLPPTPGVAHDFEVVDDWETTIHSAILEQDAAPTALPDKIRIPTFGIPGTRRFLTSSGARA